MSLFCLSHNLVYLLCSSNSQSNITYNKYNINSSNSQSPNITAKLNPLQLLLHLLILNSLREYTHRLALIAIYLCFFV